MSTAIAIPVTPSLRQKVVGSSGLWRRTRLNAASLFRYKFLDSTRATSMARMMRAVLIREFGAPNVCKLSETQVPKLDDNQVLIKVKYAGVNPVDTYIRSGTYARKPELPYIPGSDCAGVVHSVGAGVTEFKPGDTVFTASTVMGACAEYCVADSMSTFPLVSPAVTFQQGACLGVPYFTAYRALITKGGAKEGETVLVHGASGSVGSLTVQLARNLNMKVLATAGSERGMSMIREVKADHVFNHNAADYIKDVMAATDGAGVDIVIEMLANMNLQHDLDMLATYGRVVVVGNRGTVEINPRALMAKESTIQGCMLRLTTPEEWSEMGKRVVADQQAGWLRPVVSKEYDLEAVAEAHHHIINNKGAAGGVKEGETVLVHGASGSVGSLTVQLARNLNMKVAATARSERGMSMIRELKADHVFNHNAADYIEDIMAATDGAGVNIIIEMLANTNLQRDLDILALQGRVSIVGSRGMVEISPRSLMAKESTVQGCTLGHKPL